MLITKFNRMVRNRVLWAVFAILVSVAFVGSATMGSKGCRRDNGRIVGMIGGTEFSHSEYMRARAFEIGFSRNQPLSDEEDILADKLAWNRLASFVIAKNINLSCTDLELSEIKYRDPRFQRNGIFDQQLYKYVVESQFRISTDTLEEFLRQNMILTKLQTLAGTMTWTAPYELNSRLAGLTDNITAEYAIIKPDGKNKKIKATQEETLAFFEKNREMFRVPEKVRVQYFAIPVSGFLTTASVSEKDITDYYEEHISDYSGKDTNGFLATTPLSEVSADIESLLRRNSALFLAKDRATEIILALTPDRFGVSTNLADIPLTFHVSPQTSEYFSAYETVPGIDAGLDFNNTAFSLVSSDPLDRVSSTAVVGSNNVYVLVADDRQPSRIPDFSEVENIASGLANEEARKLAFRKQAESALASLRTAVSEGKSFSKAAEKLDLDASITDKFSVFSEMTNATSIVKDIAPHAAKLAKGEFTELIEHEDGFLIACIASREPGDVMSLELLRPQLISTISRYRGATVLEEWQKSILSGAQLSNVRAEEQVPPDPQPEPEPEFEL